jgi:hypothetical protein
MMEPHASLAVWSGDKLTLLTSNEMIAWGAAGLGGDDLGVANPFPPKPKAMHWRRYERLRVRHDQALQQSLMLLKM